MLLFYLIKVIYIHYFLPGGNSTQEYAIVVVVFCH